MIVKTIAFGNDSEAFIEDRLANNVNIVFSDDNNRGKTLVMQGLMYSLGYESIFPSTFNYKDQYFYSKIEIEKSNFEFLRKNKAFIVREDDNIQIFNSVSEFKHYFDRFACKLPRIIKDGKSRAVDLNLFYELFFIGQDNRTPSNLISKGQFNKADFKSMVFSIKGFSGLDNSADDIESIKNKISELKVELRTVRKKISMISANPRLAQTTSKQFDSEEVQEKKKALERINGEISKLKRSRQREINRKSRLENLLSELRSLNQNLKSGSVICGDCGSDKILFSNEDFNFDVSNKTVRKNILESIKDNIIQKSEIIFDLTEEIHTEQSNLQKELSTTPTNFEEIIVYKDYIDNDRNFDSEAERLTNEINKLTDERRLKENITEENKSEQKLFFNTILDEMMKIYKHLEPNGHLVFDDLFTKKQVTFSGSEEQEYYFSRLIALNNKLKHSFPLIVDSFRDGELSSKKEAKMLEMYSKLKKQVILTATLKSEEYSTDKYKTSQNITAIDYSAHQDCKILQSSYANRFDEILKRFEGIVI